MQGSEGTRIWNPTVLNGLGRKQTHLCCKCHCLNASVCGLWCLSRQVKRRLAQNREAARKSRMRKKVITSLECQASVHFVWPFVFVCMSFHPVLLHLFSMMNVMPSTRTLHTVPVATCNYCTYSGSHAFEHFPNLILKAYIVELESSRAKLAQLEQELQRARQQGMFIASGRSGDHGGSTGGNDL